MVCGYVELTPIKEDGYVEICRECNVKSLYDHETACYLLEEIYTHYSDEGQSFSEWIKTIRCDE